MYWGGLTKMAIRDVANKILGFLDKGVDSIDSLAKGDLGAITQSAGWTRFMFLSRLFMWIIVLSVGGLAVWHFFFRFNKRALIKKLKGGAVIDVYKDRGRIITDVRGRKKLILLRTKKSCPIPSYQYTTKMGKLDFFEFYLDEKGNLYPINDQPIIDQVRKESITDKTIDFHILAPWRLEEMKLAEQKFKKQTFIQKHMPEILVFMAMVMITAMVWITMKGITSGMYEVAAGIKQLASSLAALK